MNDCGAKSKLSAPLIYLSKTGNYSANEVIRGKENPMNTIANSRIASPLPEVLFEDECTKLLTTASTDPRIYLLFLLFLETGLKLEELFTLKVSHF
jgi:site-specific recombinase XerD